MLQARHAFSLDTVAFNGCYNTKKLMTGIAGFMIQKVIDARFDDQCQ